MSLHERLRAFSTDDLRVVRDFFDCDALRHHYTGLIADIRAELDSRDVNKRKPYSKPTLRRYGSIGDITGAVGNTSLNFDGGGPVRTKTA